MPAYTLRQLEYFSAVADARSISAAAAALHVTPTAVASALSELERILRTQLVIRRKAHGVTLTPTGVYLRRRVGDLLRDADELQLAVASGGRELVGPLQVGCYSTLAPTVIPPLMEWVRDHHPGIDMTVITGGQDELPGRLAAGALDVVIGYDMGLPDDLETRLIYEAPPYAILPPDHPLARRDVVTMPELAAEPMILLDLTPAAEHTLRLFADVGLTPVIAQRAKDFELTRAVVARGFGYSILIQRPGVNRSYEGLPIAVREIVEPSHSGHVCVMWPSRVRLTDRAAALIEFATENRDRLDPRGRAAESLA